MLNIMLEKIKNKEMTAEQVAAELSNLTWSEKHKEEDGTIWWSEGAESADIDVAIITGEISPTQGSVLYEALNDLY